MDKKKLFPEVVLPVFLALIMVGVLVGLPVYFCIQQESKYQNAESIVIYDSNGSEIDCFQGTDDDIEVLSYGDGYIRFKTENQTHTYIGGIIHRVKERVPVNN